MPPTTVLIFSLVLWGLFNKCPASASWAKIYITPLVTREPVRSSVPQLLLTSRTCY